MIDRKNRYGRTAAASTTQMATPGAHRPRRSTSTPISSCPQAAELAQPHVDLSRVPLAHFADAATRDINAQQEKDVGEVMTTIDRRLFDLDKMGIDIQVVAPAPPQCYYSVDPKIADQAHRLVNEGVAEYCARIARPVCRTRASLPCRSRSSRSANSVTRSSSKIEGRRSSDQRRRRGIGGREIPSRSGREPRSSGAFIMMHPNGFTEGDRLTQFYFNNVLGNPVETTPALHHLIFSGTLMRFRESEIDGGAWRRLSAVLFGPHRPCLGRAGGLPRRIAVAADHLSAAGLSGHGGFSNHQLAYLI